MRHNVELSFTYFFFLNSEVIANYMRNINYCDCIWIYLEDKLGKMLSSLKINRMKIENMDYPKKKKICAKKQ